MTPGRRYGRLLACRASADRGYVDALKTVRRLFDDGLPSEELTASHTGHVSPDEPVGHPWEDWTWDETVFHGTAAHYRKGRSPYAPGLADALAEHLDLDGHCRLLDVGCGPGTVTLLFAHLFDTVVGLDPDADMLTEARQAAAEQQVANATWARARAEDLPRSLGAFSRGQLRPVLPLDGPSASGGRRPPDGGTTWRGRAGRHRQPGPVR